MHFQPCTITQSSERISGQKLSISYLPGYWVFARILRFGPLPVLRRIENDQWASGVFNQRIASDYYIVTSYLNAFNLLNYNDICLYKHSRTPRLCCNVKHSSDLTPYRTLCFVEVLVILSVSLLWNLNLWLFRARKCIWYPFSCDMGLDGTLTNHIECISNTMVILMISDNSCHNMEPSWISMTGLSRTYFIIDKIWPIQSR